MIRKHEADVSWKAGMLAFAVHGILFIAMVLSINWKAAHPPMSITEVELWDQLPNKALPKPVEVKVPPKPIEPPKPVEPPKPIEPPKPEPKPEPEPPKVDIELEQKKKAAEQKKIAEEKKKAEEKLKAIQNQMREDELRQEKAADAAKQKALKALQEQMLDDKPASAQAASSVSPSVIGEYTEKIKAKIRGNVNKTLCGDGNPELTFQISVLPTGDLSGSPKLAKSSGNPTCDEAVERAIMASEPLPMPPDNAAKAEFRNLKLKFKPNGE
jgi:colicin import membrane protein